MSSTRCRGEKDNSVRQRGREESGEETRFKLGLGFAVLSEGRRKTRCAMDGRTGEGEGDSGVGRPWMRG